MISYIAALTFQRFICSIVTFSTFALILGFLIEGSLADNRRPIDKTDVFFVGPGLANQFSLFRSLPRIDSNFYERELEYEPIVTEDDGSVSNPFQRFLNPNSDFYLRNGDSKMFESGEDVSITYVHPVVRDRFLIDEHPSPFARAGTEEVATTHEAAAGAVTTAIHAATTASLAHGEVEATTTPRSTGATTVIAAATTRAVGAAEPSVAAQQAVTTAVSVVAGEATVRANAEATTPAAGTTARAAATTEAVTTRPITGAPTTAGNIATTTTEKNTQAATTAKANEPAATTKPNEPAVTTAKATEPSGTTLKATEPAGTTPKVTEPAAATTKANEPAVTTAKATEPAGTTTKATEPAGTTAKVTEPAIGTTAAGLVTTRSGTSAPGTTRLGEEGGATTRATTKSLEATTTAKVAAPSTQAAAAANTATTLRQSSPANPSDASANMIIVSLPTIADADKLENKPTNMELVDRLIATQLIGFVAGYVQVDKCAYELLEMCKPSNGSNTCSVDDCTSRCNALPSCRRITFASDGLCRLETRSCQKQLPVASSNSFIKVSNVYVQFPGNCPDHFIMDTSLSDDQRAGCTRCTIEECKFECDLLPLCVGFSYADPPPSDGSNRQCYIKQDVCTTPVQGTHVFYQKLPLYV